MKPLYYLPPFDFTLDMTWRVALFGVILICASIVDDLVDGYADWLEPVDYLLWSMKENRKAKRAKSAVTIQLD